MLCITLDFGEKGFLNYEVYNYHNLHTVKLSQFGMIIIIQRITFYLTAIMPVGLL